VEIRLYAEYLEVWYGQHRVDKIDRLRGEGRHRINYRHIIDWLVRKPGAFENYRYRHDLFPTHRYRMAYDVLRRCRSLDQANKEYLRILHLAARENEAEVEKALGHLIDTGEPITVETVKLLVGSSQRLTSPRDVVIADVDTADYDVLLEVGL